MDSSLADLLIYDPITGNFFWRVSIGANAKAGVKVKCANNRGYARIKIRGKFYLAHRLAWLISYGAWPKAEIDHIDGNGCNNVLTNLRDVPKAINLRNCKKRLDNTSGFTGISKITMAEDYWAAQWFDGTRKGRYFSIRKYGDAAARQMAIDFRAAQIALIGGYTVRHGVEK